MSEVLLPCEGTMAVEPLKPKDECGIVGVWAPGQEVALLTYGALQELQGRGQSGAGIMVYDRDLGMIGHKGNGVVDQALPEVAPRGSDGRSPLDVMTNSPVALGHVRYSTSRSNSVHANHPFRVGSLAAAHNGNIPDMDGIARSWGVDPTRTISDSHTYISTLSAAAEHFGDIPKAINALGGVNGAYCITVTDGKALYAARDPWGFHPLSIGALEDGGYMIASEPPAYEAFGGSFLRDVEPGEIIKIDDEGIQIFHMDRQEPRRICRFEYIYTARQDSVVDGKVPYLARKYMGAALARTNTVEADLVIGVPDSGLPVAIGYAEESGLPLAQGLFKNPYIARTFIQRGDQRANSLRRKQRPNLDEIHGKRLIVGDDSMIKGNTMRNLIRLLKEAGAAEVHIKSAASRYEKPCYMGMDTGDPKELIAQGRTDEEIAAMIGADSVSFNAPKDVEEAILKSGRIGRSSALKVGSFCTACTDGNYPFPVAGESKSGVFLGMPQVGRSALKLTQ